MIPLLATLHVRRAENHGFRLWLPLFLLWLVLFPIVLVLLPFIIVLGIIGQVNPFRALRVLWQCLGGLKGAHVEVDSGSESVLIRVC